MRIFCGIIFLLLALPFVAFDWLASGFGSSCFVINCKSIIQAQGQALIALLLSSSIMMFLTPSGRVGGERQLKFTRIFIAAPILLVIVLFIWGHVHVPDTGANQHNEAVNLFGIISLVVSFFSFVGVSSVSTTEHNKKQRAD